MTANILFRCELIQFIENLFSRFFHLQNHDKCTAAEDEFSIIQRVLSQNVDSMQELPTVMLNMRTSYFMSSILEKHPPSPLKFTLDVKHCEKQ